MPKNNVKNACETQSQNRKAALDAVAHGFRVFPVRVTRNDKTGKKEVHPLVAWGSEATSHEGQVEKWWDKFPTAAPGLVTGEVFVVDLDDRDGKNGTVEYKALGLDPGDALFAVRTPSGGQHLYFNGVDGVTVHADKVAPGIDTRGHRGFVFAPGARTVFGQYKIERGELFDLQHGLLTNAPEPILRALEKPEPEPDTDQPDPGQHDLDTLRDALGHVPNDGSYDDWCETLMALHHATGGSKDGLALAVGWSAGYPGFSFREVQDKWKSFGRKDGLLITADTLFAKAKKNGWGLDFEWDDDDEPEPSIADLLDDDTGPSVEDLLDDAAPPPLEYEGLTFLTPAECAATDPRPYVVKGLLAERDVACIVGAPGVGKSLLAPRLAYAVAQGEPVFDRRVKQGSVFYVAAEDEHGMRGRLRALRDDLGDSPNLHLVGGITDLLTTEPVKVKGKTRQRCKQADTLAKAVRERKPGLVVIDTLAMAFPGLEENSAEGMGRVVALARRLTKWGAAVVLIHHDTKDGQQGLPRGHSLLNGALDVSIHLRKGDKGVVTGKLTKNRNGSCDLDLAFRIRAAEIGADADGDPVTAAVCDPCPPLADDRKARLTDAEQGALDLVFQMAADGTVRETAWRKVAVEGFAVSGSEDRDNRRRSVARALQGLLRKRQLIVENGLISIPYAVEDDEWEDDVEGADHGDA